jgi:hypothetical protein
MMKKPVTTKAPAEQVVKDIWRATRKLHSSEERHTRQIPLTVLDGVGPAPVLFRSGAHVRRLSVRRPRVISSRGMSVCGAGCRSR